MALIFNDVQRRRVLLNRGLDPEKFDINPETGNIDYRPTREQPTITSPEVITEQDTQPPKSSAISAFGQGFVSGVAPSFGGAAGGMGLARLGGMLGRPFGPIGIGVGTGLGAITGAVGGSTLTDKIQSMLLPKSIEEGLATTAAEHPIAFPAGRFASNLILAKPSIDNLRLAASTGKNLLSRLLPGVGAEAPITANQISNLGNVLVGGGLGAAIPLAQGSSIPEALLYGAGGALLNQPTGIAQKLFGFQPTLKETPALKAGGGKLLRESTLAPKETLQEFNQRQLREKAQQEAAEKHPLYKRILEATDEQEKFDISETEQRPKTFFSSKDSEGNYDVPFKTFARELKRVAPSFFEKGKLTKDINEEYLRAFLDDKIHGQETMTGYRQALKDLADIEARNEKEFADVTRVKLRGEAEEKTAKYYEDLMAKEQARVKEQKDLEARRESNYQAYKNLLKSGDLAESEKFLKTMPGEAQYFKRRYVKEKTTGKTEAFEELKEGEPLPSEYQKKLEERRRMFQPEEKTGLEAKERLLKTAEEAGTTGKIRATKSFHDIFNTLFGQRRNVKVGLDNKLVQVNDKGEVVGPAKGATDMVREGIKARMIDINPELASPDTLPHEYTHSFLRDLLDSPNEYDRKFAKKLLDSIKNTEEYKSSGYSDPEEFLTETTGYEIFNRAVNLDKKGGSLSQSWKDFLARLKFKWGNATAEQLNRIVAKRFLEDPDFVETHIKPKLGVVKGGELKDADETKNRKVESEGIETPGKTKETAGEKVKKDLQEQVSEPSKVKGAEIAKSGPSEPTTTEGQQTEEKAPATSEPKKKLYQPGEEEQTSKKSYDVSWSLKGFGNRTTTVEANNIQEQTKISNQFDFEQQAEAEKLQYKEDLAAWKKRKAKAENAGLEFNEDPPDNPNKLANEKQFQSENQGLDVLKKATKDRQDALLENTKMLLEARGIYNAIKVEGKMPSDIAGRFFRDKNLIQSRANDVETALHESIHKIIWDNRESLKKIVGRGELTADEIKAAGQALGSISATHYGRHRDTMTDLAAYITANNVGLDKAILSETRTDALFNAIDEAAAQLSSKSSLNVGQRQALENLVSKTLGKDFTEFLTTGSREEKYFPKFVDDFAEQKKNLRQKLRMIQKKQIEVIDLIDDAQRVGAKENQTIYAAQLDNIAAARLKVEEALEKINREHPGRYYQPAKAQGLEIDEILANISNASNNPDFQKEGLLKRNLKELPSRLPIFGSELDKLPLRAGKEGAYIHPNIREYYDKARANEGRWLNPTLEAWNKLNKTDARYLQALMLKEKRTGKTLEEQVPQKLKPIYDITRKLLLDKQENQIEAKQPVEEFVKTERGFKSVPRLPKINPYYYPEVIGAKQLDLLLNHRNAPGFQTLKNDFIRLQKEKYDINTHQAVELFNDLLSSYGGPLAGSQTRFGAVRKAEGIGLPDSWLESDPSVLLRRYWRRVSKDRAWFDAVESDHNNLAILGQSKDAWGKDIKPTEDFTDISGNEALKNVLDIVHGENIRTNPKLDALSRIANNLILGPVTGVNDLISAIPTMAKFIPSPWDVPKVLSAVWDIGKGIENVRKTGGVKLHLSDMEDFIFPKAELVENLRKIGDGISKITGRQKLEEWSRGLSQAVGEKLIDIHRANAINGDKKSIALLDDLANKRNWRGMDNKELATRLMQLSQGTYDIRGLPSVAINSQIAPLLRMSKWNIEQLNNLHKYAIVPMLRDGNFTPLLNTLVGGALGGYLAKEVREKLTNKKTQIPQWDEIMNVKGEPIDKINAATYNLAGALSYSGVLGIMGEFVKSGYDLSFNNKPQGFNYPMAELTGDVMVNTAQAADAIANGEDPIKVLVEYNKQLFALNTQAGRLAYNWLGDKGQREASGERRDLRVFRQLSGRPVTPQGSGEENPYTGLDIKAFKKLDKIEDIIDQTPIMIKKAIVNAKGDPEVLKKNLSRLKRTSTTTLPSYESSPVEFSNYYNYLQRTLGPEEAKNRLLRYGKQKSLNELRSKSIPSL